MHSLAQKQKIYKSLGFFLAFSCSMIFAGLISAYLVSSQDMYWVIFPAPKIFWLGIFILISSSASAAAGIKFLKKNKFSASIFSFLLTFFLGLTFVYTQYCGILFLAEKGLALSSPIIAPISEIHLKNEKHPAINLTVYLSYQDQNLYADPYFSEENLLTKKSIFTDKIIDLQNNILEHKLGTSHLRLILEDGFFYTFEDHERLFPLNTQRISYAGIIIPEGTYGKDYSLRWRHQDLVYKNTEFFMPNDLNTPINSKIVAYKNNAVAYLFVLAGLHFLHLFVTLGMLLYIVYGIASKKYHAKRYFGVETGVYFWHFLMFLWLFLFVFLFYGAKFLS